MAVLIAGIALVGGSARLALIGRSGEGRALLRFEYQLAPIGAPFGSAQALAPAPQTDTGLPGLFGSREPLFEDITTLDPDKNYHWRVRSTSVHPFFPRSPWLTLVGDSWVAMKLRGSAPETPIQTQ